METVPLRFCTGHMQLIFSFYNNTEIILFEIILTSLCPGIGLYFPYASLSSFSNPSLTLKANQFENFFKFTFVFRSIFVFILNGDVVKHG